MWNPTDPGREIDWGRTSEDYAAWRPGYPDSFWRRLEALDVAVAGRRVLDLATGTGVIARPLAARGCAVTGVDVAANQVEQARELAARDGLDVDFRVSPAEETGLPDASFDLITASQCWPYFDRERVLAEARRLLVPGGRLMTCHVCWLALEDDIPRRSEELVLKHNPAWTAAGYEGRVPAFPHWIGEGFDLVAMFWYDEELPFTRESWRGRLRACRGVGAALSPEEVARFDEEHAALLEATVAESFTVRHRIDAHVVTPSAS